VICEISEEALAMAITVEAVYENGVLKPSEPLPFKEHEKVSVTVVAARGSLAAQIAGRASALPQETLDRLPADGASQHDHHIYGTPKRPE
jgi:predicted DNA-binding antitoxin AbrB/MazE fold protein